MIYPTISEYIESIKYAEDNFATLTNLRPVFDDSGNPVMSSGNFAVVFKMKDEQTDKMYAVKCFLKDQEGRAEAYHMICKELEQVSSNYIVPIKYKDKELFVPSSSSSETEFPVLLMDWVEGITLDKYVINNKFDGYKLAKLSYNFYSLSNWLLSQSFAHGDLKPDNILVKKDGSLVLIDYDGMFVPNMIGQKSRENGTPDFRPPLYDTLIYPFSKSMDDFAIIQILLSLRIYSLHPHLITSNNEFAVFRNNEFSDISNTETYKHLLSSVIDSHTSIMLMIFQKAILFGTINKGDWQLLDLKEPENSFFDMGEMMTSLDNIIEAMTLAYSAMSFKDPARNESEYDIYKDINDKISLALEIQFRLEINDYTFFSNGIKYSYLKPNGLETREGIALDMTEYTLKYLMGLVKYKSMKKTFPNNIFGGGKDVFNQINDNNSFLDEFVGIQETCAKRYRYLYVFDIKNFFKSVNLEKLKQLYFGNAFTNVEWFDKLYDKIFKKDELQGLNSCAEVDSFFANLYLLPLDEVLISLGGIEYYRYSDDIRIYSNDNSLLKKLTIIIESVLLPLSLELNEEKTKMIDTTKDKLDLAKACFIWSCKLYLGTNEAQTELLKGQDLADIINNELTTTYIFKLLREINNLSYHDNGSLSIHLDNLLYILRNVHKNSTLYKVVSELIFDIGLNYKSDGTLFSYILDEIVKTLRDENVEPFVKYWILRIYFCSDKQYYKKYIEEENIWREQSWYPNPCYNEQIIKMLEADFRKSGTYKLLFQIADYVISYIDPSMNMTSFYKYDEDELPF